MAKIFIVSPIHKWDDVRVFKKEAMTLSESGMEVTLYAKSPKDFVKDKIQIRSVSKERQPLFKRIKDQFKLFKILKNGRPDVVHFHNPDTLPLAIISKYVFKYRVIYDTHEDFSKRILMREWIPKIFRYPIAKSIELLEIMACYLLDDVIVTQDNLKEKYKNKPKVILNAPVISEKDFEKSKIISEGLSISNKFKFVYIGGISKSRGIEEFLDAYLIFSEKYGIESSEFYLIGPIQVEYLNYLKSQKKWELVKYLGELPQEEAFAYLIKSDVGICTILDVGDHKNTSANKLYEYQRYMKPFIATDFPKWKKELEHVGSGIFVNPQDKNELSNAMEFLYRNRDECEKMGGKGLEYIEQKFNWDIESKKLLDIYKELLK